MCGFLSLREAFEFGGLLEPNRKTFGGMSKQFATVLADIGPTEGLGGDCANTHPPTHPPALSPLLLSRPPLSFPTCPRL